jgi:hypothetical protein
MLTLEPPMPTIDLTCLECNTWTALTSDSEDESSCSEIEYGHMTCYTREVCGEETYKNSQGNWIYELSYCEPRCPLPFTMWNPETNECESYDPPPTCEEKLVAHVSRETEV